jgi:hypothetical protein
MNIYKNPMAFILLLALTACAPGIGDISLGPTGFTPPPTNQRAGGLWYGTLTFDASMGSEEAIGMIGEDGQFRLISADTLIQMSGTVTVAGSSLTGSGKAFASPGGNWPDGSTVGDVSLTATVAQRVSIIGAWSTTATESGTFELFYDSLYERDSALSLLDGLWTAYDDLGNPNVTFTIQNSGSFDGQNMQGCVSIGQFSIIDAEYDLYKIQSTVSGCTIAGDFTGLAVLADLAATNDALVFAVDNGIAAILLGFQK